MASAAWPEWATRVSEWPDAHNMSSNEVDDSISSSTIKILRGAVGSADRPPSFSQLATCCASLTLTGGSCPPQALRASARFCGSSESRLQLVVAVSKVFSAIENMSYVMALSSGSVRSNRLRVHACPPRAARLQRVGKASPAAFNPSRFTAALNPFGSAPSNTTRMHRTASVRQRTDLAESLCTACRSHQSEATRLLALPARVVERDFAYLQYNSARASESFGLPPDSAVAEGRRSGANE